MICGSLNPGQDGVGDYTRRLAAQLTQDGHDCLLMALNDVEDSEETTDRIQIIRFKQCLSSPQKSLQAQQLIAQWQPDWISLQFVCFSFHPKGFIHRLTPFIKGCLGTAKLNIMFHELWVGEQPSLPLKHKVMGMIQRHLILKALKVWNVDAIHTSNPLYQSILSKHGYDAFILPLFGNIPITVEDPRDDTCPPNQRILLFPFSQRHDWNVVETMERLQSLAHEAGIQWKFVQVGKLRSGAQHWDIIQNICKTQGWQCKMLGPQSGESVSRLMQQAHIGISSAHIALAGKSGAVAAMQEHGLPVICTATQAVSRRFKSEPAMHSELYSLFDNEARLVDLVRSPKRLAAKPLLPAVAEQLERDLSNSTS